MDAHPPQEALAIFQLTIPDLAALTSHYMPCFRHGGLLVNDHRNLLLTTPVFMLLTLPGEEDIVACNGQIASLLRHYEKDQKGRKAITYSVQFSQDSSDTDSHIRKLIERKGLAMPGFGETALS